MLTDSRLSKYGVSMVFMVESGGWFVVLWNVLGQVCRFVERVSQYSSYFYPVLRHLKVRGSFFLSWGQTNGSVEEPLLA